MIGFIRVRDGSGEAIRTPEARLNGRTATLLLFAKWPCDTATEPDPRQRGTPKQLKQELVKLLSAGIMCIFISGGLVCA